MIVCRAENASRHYTSDPVFSDVSFQIFSGDRIGLVGPNGAGKSTLLRLLADLDRPDSGKVEIHSDASVALHSQFPDFSPEQTLFAEVKSAMSHLEHWHEEMLDAGRKLAAAGEAAERTKWSSRYDELQERLRTHGGYEFDHRIEEVLTGLRFEPADFHRPLSTFSGGQQSRAMLAKMLLRSADLMLLDEPTNHLDIPTTEWLEDFLCRQSMAMVIVSHDRYFLDKTTTRIFELFGGKLTSYAGNYQQYVRQRDEREVVLERVATKQREEIAHHEDFIRRYKYGLLAKQAKSREKMVARIEAERVETRASVRGPAMGFGKATRAGDIVLTATDVAKSYDRMLFEGVNLTIERGRRVGIIGANGSGKTTLLRILLGEEAPTKGAIKRGHNVKIGYLDQELAMLDLDATPLDAVRPEWKYAEKEEVFRGALARFGVGADMAEQKMATMSGGERARVALARLSTHEVNLLALDEPTNHLDLWARESLERSLLEFEGTVLVVSHDRYFLNQTVERLLLVVDGRVRTIDGGYDRYQDLQKEAATKEQAEKDRTNRRATPAALPVEKRKRKFPFRKVADIESEIEEREVLLAELEASLLEPEVYKDGRKAREVSIQIQEHKTALASLLDHWEEAMELNPS